MSFGSISYSKMLFNPQIMEGKSRSDVKLDIEGEEGIRRKDFLK